MKNLKKISREAAKQINGGLIGKCSRTNPCTVGWCCNGVCSPRACIEN
ncbi:bacteriocin-like protein [Chryseobacterium sp. G0162]